VPGVANNSAGVAKEWVALVGRKLQHAAVEYRDGHLHLQVQSQQVKLLRKQFRQANVMQLLSGINRQPLHCQFLAAPKG
jgi:hypothetical protein